MATTSARNQLNQTNYLINDKGEQLSFYEHNYKSYNPFSRITKSINFNGGIKFVSFYRINLSDNADLGDLITNMTVKIKLPDISGKW